VKPEHALPAGEYALVLNTGEVRSMGLANMAVPSLVDFGVGD